MTRWYACIHDARFHACAWKPETMKNSNHDRHIAQYELEIVEWKRKNIWRCARRNSDWTYSSFDFSIILSWLSLYKFPLYRLAKPLLLGVAKWTRGTRIACLGWQYLATNVAIACSLSPPLSYVTLAVDSIHCERVNANDGCRLRGVWNRKKNETQCVFLSLSLSRL